MNIENANSHPYKVVLTKDTDEMYANSHPYQVEIVGGGGGTEGKVVDELPEEGETGYIYLVLKEESEEGNIYDEYMWVLQQDETYGWEHIGATDKVSVTAIKTLTVADYNYPAGNPTSVASWLLESGLYRPEKGVLVKGAYNTTTTCGGTECWLVIKPTDNQNGQIICFAGDVSRIWFSIDSNGQNSTVSDFIPIISQTTGTNTSYVMSQNAVTSMVFADPSTKYRVRLGDNASVSGNNGLAIGVSSEASGNQGIALGPNAKVTHGGSVAIGQGSKTSVVGEVSFGGTVNAFTYNSSGYRLLTNVHDPVNDHDAATKGYVNNRLGGLTLVSISQTDYDALVTKDPNTLYVITGA